ncbi:MAG: sugar transferase [Anaerolineales bacterium]|jgi:exopolysaccharide biosynthesis polyprenyl glycosylphosphotransferase
MIRRFSVNFAIFSIALDSLLIAGTLYFADYIRPFLNKLDFIKYLPPDHHIPLAVYPFFVAIWILILNLFSVYDGRKNIRVVDEFVSISVATILAAIASAGSLYLSYRDVSRALFLIFVALAFLLLITWRVIFRIIIKVRGIELINRRVLVIGAGKVGLQMKKQIQQHNFLGLKFIGFLDDEVDLPEVIGYLKDVRDVVGNQKIDDVVVALPRQAYQRVNQLVADLLDLPVKVWVIPDYFSLVLHQAAVEEYAGIPMLDLRAPALNDYQRLVKRIFDLSLTILFSPFILMIIAGVSVLIKIFDPGPVFFTQDRVGENGKIFKFYKFRSMVVGADARIGEVMEKGEQGKIIHKMKDDPRITPLGRFLRRTSLDEFPQFLNVLKGEMSLVGPRPELPLLVENYEPWQRTRFAMPPGLTGWWQVEGRSERPMHLNTEDDLYYVKNYSIWLDLFIILKTVGVVLRGKGAF